MREAENHRGRKKDQTDVGGQGRMGPLGHRWAVFAAAILVVMGFMVQQQWQEGQQKQQRGDLAPAGVTEGRGGEEGLGLQAGAQGSRRLGLREFFGFKKAKEGPSEILGTVPAVVKPTDNNPNARIAYLIMGTGEGDVPKISKLLSRIHHADNLYLIHLDKKTPQVDIDVMRTLLSPYENAQLLEPALTVSWGGFSVTLTALFGMGAALSMSDKWDYFINLSASDFPLMRQEEIMGILGKYKNSGISFMKGSVMDYNQFGKRLTGYIDDQHVYRNRATRNPFVLLGTGPKGNRPGGVNLVPPRELPDRFQVFKGEFWHIAHRSFAKYVVESPNNVARSMISYFSKMRISDESYFQTVFCHPETPNTMLAFGDPMRHVNWVKQPNEAIMIHPEPLQEAQMPQLKQSGAFFARKFNALDPSSKKALEQIETWLKDDSSAASADRLKKGLDRIGGASRMKDKWDYCNADGRLTEVGKYGLGAGVTPADVTK